MAGVATAIAGAAVLGTAATIYSGNKAAGAQRDAANQASNTQMAMFNGIQQQEAPWVKTGGQANQALASFYGLGGAKPDYNKILSGLPGYQFQLQQGTNAVDHNLAARGLLQSGAAGKALTQYGQGLAQNYAGQYAGGLESLSRFGQAGAANTAAAGMNAANQIGSNQIYAGNAAADGYTNTANAVNGGLQGLASSYGYYQANQNMNYNRQYDNLQPIQPGFSYMSPGTGSAGTTTYYGPT